MYSLGIRYVISFDNRKMVHSCIREIKSFKTVKTFYLHLFEELTEL